jgi:hypothetical protein
MKAAVVREFGEPLLLEDRPISIDDVLHGRARARIVLEP